MADYWRPLVRTHRWSMAMTRPTTLSVAFALARRGAALGPFAPEDGGHEEDDGDGSFGIARWR